jgi:hypothetical protein
MKVKNINEDNITGNIIKIQNNNIISKIGTEYSTTNSNIIDWIIIKNKETIGNFSNYNFLLNTLINRNNKLNKFINQDTINKYSKLSDLEIIQDVVSKPDIKASYFYGENDFKKIFYDNFVKREYHVYLNSSKARVIEYKNNTTYYLSFYILPNGKILNPRVLNGSVDKRREIIAIIEHINKWEPAIYNNQKVISHKIVELNFDWIYQ